jgi:hypothetical protein
MRYIDIDLLQRPDGWQARADAALNALRNEVNNAGEEADNAGQDVAGIIAARKTAIRNGLDMPVREQIWGDLAPKLAELSKNKCWYSESRNPTADKNVDHFRPKKRVEEEPEHEGYWWKAFDWRNYRYASQWCNQRRIDEASGTRGGKLDRFPLTPNSLRAWQEADDCDQEEPQLLDPTDPEDWRLLAFRSNGESFPSANPQTPPYVRAEVSIEVYHLNCHELVTERRPIAGQVERLVQELERLRPQITDVALRRIYKDRQKDLLRLLHHEADYSAAALSYARQQVFKLEEGHQVKREWLEQILNFQA